MIDFHTHILPEIDDGCSSAEESVVLLKMLKEQGVDKVLLTPHFYAYSSAAESFYEERKSALNKLLTALEKDPVDVELYLGCEVLYFDELWRIENLKEFCIVGTEYIMIELPFAPWGDSIVRGIEKIIGKGLTPIIAHIERYIKYSGNPEKLYELVEMGAILQINTGYINKFFKRKKAIKGIKRGIISAIGTDCHNLTDRAPECGKVDGYLKKYLSEKQLKRFNSIQKMILSDAVRVYPVKK